MSDLMREEFERTNGRDHRRNPPKGNNYIDPMAQEDWASFQKGWKQSRECLVIDLPDTKEIMPLSPGMYVHEMRKIVDENKYTRAIDLARCAIHAAGVKTK